MVSGCFKRDGGPYFVSIIGVVPLIGEMSYPCASHIVLCSIILIYRALRLTLRVIGACPRQLVDIAQHLSSELLVEILLTTA